MKLCGGEYRSPRLCHRDVCKVCVSRNVHGASHRQGELNGLEECRLSRELCGNACQSSGVLTLTAFAKLTLIPSPDGHSPQSGSTTARQLRRRPALGD